MYNLIYSYNFSGYETDVKVTSPLYVYYWGHNQEEFGMEEN